MILPATQLWKDINENDAIPFISKKIASVEVGPLVVADSAFPFFHLANEAIRQCNSHSTRKVL